MKYKICKECKGKAKGYYNKIPLCEICLRKLKGGNKLRSVEKFSYSINPKGNY
jgi:ribosomal protein S14